MDTGVNSLLFEVAKLKGELIDLYFDLLKGMFPNEEDRRLLINMVEPGELLDFLRKSYKDNIENKS